MAILGQKKISQLQ